MDVYQRSYEVALHVHKATLSFPKEEQFALSSQMRRASKGICANLAEGFAKSHKSPAEFKRFALMALGSAEEMTVWLDFAKDLEYIKEDEWQDGTSTYRTICRQLYTMIDKWKV